MIWILLRIYNNYKAIDKVYYFMSNKELVNFLSLPIIVSLRYFKCTLLILLLSIYWLISSLLKWHRRIF